MRMDIAGQAAVPGVFADDILHGTGGQTHIFTFIAQIDMPVMPDEERFEAIVPGIGIARYEVGRGIREEDNAQFAAFAAYAELFSDHIDTVLIQIDKLRNS